MKFESLCDSIRRQTSSKRVVVIVGRAGCGIDSVADYLFKDYLVENGGVVERVHSHDSCFHELLSVNNCDAVAIKGLIVNKNYTKIKSFMKPYLASNKVIISIQLPVHNKIKIEILDYLSKLFINFTLIKIDMLTEQYKYEELEVVAN